MLSAYYFRAHMYTIVPRQVREDFTWMRDHGSDAVVVGVLEQDLFAARENLDILCREAERLGLRVLVTPSRWGNLIAGCPKVPSILCATRLDCWAQRADGSPWMGFLGPYASIHHHATLALFETALRDLLQSWPISGIIWDEPKTFTVIDHSPTAKAAMGVEWSDALLAHQQALVAFFGHCNGVIKGLAPHCRTGLFIHAHYDGGLLDHLAAMPDLDDFGCDGRPWARIDGGVSDNGNGTAPSKFLVDAGPRFIAAARTAGRKPLALIENHALPASCNVLMQRRLPEIREQGWKHLLYYYFPRSCETPEASMAILGDQLRQWRMAIP